MDFIISTRFPANLAKITGKVLVVVIVSPSALNYAGSIIMGE
jgi:hypothetical protein